jgi:hypothetical protein
MYDFCWFLPFYCVHLLKSRPAKAARPILIINSSKDALICKKVCILVVATLQFFLIERVVTLPPRKLFPWNAMQLSDKMLVLIIVKIL